MLVHRAAHRVALHHSMCHRMWHHMYHLRLGVGGAQLLGVTRPLEIENRFSKKVYEMT